MDFQALQDEVAAASRLVPFGNSTFQIQTFTGGEHGPERRHRTLLLNMNETLKCLRDTKFRRRRADIDLRELSERLAGADGYDRERLALDIEEKEAQLADEDKLIEDALISLEAMYREWKSLPPLESREQFEVAEAGYWTRRLWSDACREVAAHGAPAVGTVGALNQLGLVVRRNELDWQLAGPSNLIAALASPTVKEIPDGR